MLRITNLNESYIPITVNGKMTKICFDYEPFEDSNIGTGSEHTFNKERSHTQIKEFILSEMNKRIDEKILTGFHGNDMQVGLSSENQFNYKAAYDLAVQTNGANLPLVFKFGTNDHPVYHTFKTVEDLTNFYISAMTYINQCLSDGGARKDAINGDDYKIND